MSKGDKNNEFSLAVWLLLEAANVLQSWYDDIAFYVQHYKLGAAILWGGCQ